MDKKNNSFKKLGKHLVRTSITLLDSLFNDNSEQQQLIEKHREQLLDASRRKALVVLQLKTKKVAHFETVVGYVTTKRSIDEQVVIKIQNNLQQLRIVALRDIEKVSVLDTKNKHKLIAK